MVRSFGLLEEVGGFRGLKHSTDAEVNQLSHVVGVKDNVLRFDISVQDALLMTVLQAIGDFSYLPLDCLLHDVPAIVYKLMVRVWRERVCFW